MKSRQPGGFVMKGKIRQAAAWMAVALLAAGCASAPPQALRTPVPEVAGTTARVAAVRALPAEEVASPAVPAGAAAPSTPAFGTKLLSITQLSAANDTWTNPSSVGGKFNGMYTKLVVRAKDIALSAGTGGDQAGNVDYLPYTRRRWLERALFGYDFSVTLTAKVTVKDTLDLTVPLAIVGHASNSDGETWVREIDLSRSDFPLFLFRSDGTSVPSLTLEVKGSKSVASKGAAAAVSAITGIAKLAGADPAVITTLTKASTKAATQEVDNAISKLFSSSVTERFVSDRDLKLWGEEGSSRSPQGLVVDLVLPETEEDWNVKNRRPIATWTLTFANPRPSVFYEWNVCEADDVKARCSQEVEDARVKVAKGVTPADVLHFRLVPTANGLGQIDAYLRQQKWFTDASVALARSGNDAAAMNMFCQNVVDSMTSLGLNQFDGVLVLWAVDTGMPTGLPKLSSERCADFLKPVSEARRA